MSELFARYTDLAGGQQTFGCDQVGEIGWQIFNIPRLNDHARTPQSGLLQFLPCLFTVTRVLFQADDLQFGSLGQLIRKSAGITFEYERVALGDAAVGDNPFRCLAVELGSLVIRIRMGIHLGFYDLYCFPFTQGKAINRPFVGTYNEITRCCRHTHGRAVNTSLPHFFAGFGLNAYDLSDTSDIQNISGQYHCSKAPAGIKPFKARFLFFLFGQG